MEVYITKLSRVLDHLAILLRDRGYSEFPHSSSTDVVALAMSKSCSIGEALSCNVTRAGKTLSLVFLDPVFDASKGGRETQTSSFQLHAAASPFRADTLALAISYPKLSPDASKTASRLRKKTPGCCPLEVLTFAQLAFPLSRHILVPLHIALTPSEAREFQAVRRISRDSLPVLKMSDPVRIWYGWPVNTIIQVNRPTGLAWRVVKH